MKKEYKESGARNWEGEKHCINQLAVVLDQHAIDCNGTVN